MKNNLPILLMTMVTLFGSSLNAQTRYKDPVFANVDVVQDITFGVNVDFLLSNTDESAQADLLAEIAALTTVINEGNQPTQNFFVPNSFLPEEQHTTAKLAQLQMDIYTPSGDTVSNRPVIIYLHTGNFLPPLFSGGITGSRRDSAVVNSCKRWARAGYTAAALSYRLGWNPLSDVPDVRRGTLLNAVYRAIHDTQSGVRFLRASASLGNPYGIDPDKIVLYGQGSGGYVAQAYNALDDWATEIANLTKFQDEGGTPYVLPPRDGDVNGSPGALRLPDPLQSAGISKDINMAINAGGALADISWVDQGEAPVLTFHCVRDPFAPFDNGTVVVPTTTENVVAVSGGNVFVQTANDLGNNDAFINFPDGDPFTDRARSLYGTTWDYLFASQPTITISESPEGLFPFILPINTMGDNIFTNESGPWDWWDFATLQQVVAGTNAQLGTDFDAQVFHTQGLAGNPGMSAAKGNAYLDTIQGYMLPRVMCVLELPGVECGPTNTDNTVLESTTAMFPNPTQHALTIRNNEYRIQRVEVYDITGRVVASDVVNGHEYRFERGNLVNGIYLVQVVFDDQRVTKKVVFN